MNAKGADIYAYVLRNDHHNGCSHEIAVKAVMVANLLLLLLMMMNINTASHLSPASTQRIHHHHANCRRLEIRSDNEQLW